MYKTEKSAARKTTALKNKLRPQTCIVRFCLGGRLVKLEKAIVNNNHNNIKHKFIWEAPIYKQSNQRLRRRGEVAKPNRCNSHAKRVNACSYADDSRQGDAAATRIVKFTDGLVANFC